MKLPTIYKSLTLAAFLIPGYMLVTCTMSGAQVLPAQTNAPAQQVAQSTPELDEANAKLDQAKQKLDTARAQLTCAKAMVKAADAEFRACKANRDALAMRNEAQRLADLSGFPTQTAPQIAATRLYPVAQPATPVPATPVDTTKTRIDQVDFNAQTSDSEAQAQAANIAGKENFAGAPVPLTDLKPQQRAAAPQEPNSVP